jgi:hypothetical protein
VLSERFRILSESAANPFPNFETHIADTSFLFIIFSSGRPVSPAQGIDLCDHLHSGICDPVYTNLCGRLYTDLCERLYTGLRERLYTVRSGCAQKSNSPKRDLSNCCSNICAVKGNGDCLNELYVGK